MTSKPIYTVVFLLVAVGALAFRRPRLDLAPFHGDEANQAYRTGVLLDTGVYRYDPHEYHGPTLYFLTLPVAWLSSATRFAQTSPFTFRVVPVVFGAGLVLLLWLLRDGLGARPTLYAAALLALSPAMVYYSRYYVQEMLLAFFTLAAIACGWRYSRRPSVLWAMTAGLSIGLMHATKETCVLAYAAMTAALALNYWTRREELGPKPWRRIPAAHLAVFAVAAVGVSVLFFSSFFTYAQGPLDSLRTYLNYLDRSGATGKAPAAAHLHDHPWYYYLALLIYFKNGLGAGWSEGFLLLLALAGVTAAIARPAGKGPGHPLLLRFLILYTVLLTAAYSVIPYKTPWCLLSFLTGIILLAGVGAEYLLSLFRRPVLRAGIAAILAAGTLHLGMEAYRASFVCPANPNNPYVYAHTVPSLLDLVQRIEDIARLAPDGKHTLIKVIEPTGDYWPLPFYLRTFDRVGYWTQIPDNPDAPLIVTSPQAAPLLEVKLHDRYKSSHFGLRPDVLLILYVRADLWDAFIKTRE